MATRTPTNTTQKLHQFRLQKELNKQLTTFEAGPRKLLQWRRDERKGQYNEPAGQNGQDNIAGGEDEKEPTAQRPDHLKDHLPGQPRHKLIDPLPKPGQSETTPKKREDANLIEHLRKTHLTRELDGLLPYMRFIFVQTPSYRHIMPLHHQKAHDREITTDELPGLHLVWYYERMFIKPIPEYFFSAAFWEYIRDAEPDVHKAALGFMRSYWFIIQYPIDYDLACEKKLIPKKPGAKTDDDKYHTYEEFSEFLESFSPGNVTDDMVSRRYHYGELRLTRINRAAIFKGKLAYFHIYPQWGSFLQHIVAPLVTIFAIASVILNSMQVSLQALETDWPEDGWPRFRTVSVYFPIAIILMIALVLAVGLFGLIFMAIKDFTWAQTTRQRKKSGNKDAGERSHGMIW